MEPGAKSNEMFLEKNRGHNEKLAAALFLELKARGAGGVKLPDIFIEEINPEELDAVIVLGKEQFCVFFRERYQPFELKAQADGC